VDLALGADGDIDLTGGEARLVSGVDALVQHLRIRYRTFLGEWYGDRRIGVPWFQVVFVKNPNMRLVRSLIREVAITTPGVAAVLELRVTVNSARVAAISFVCRTTENVTFPFTFSEPVLEVEA
jgi:hypothetical protein